MQFFVFLSTSDVREAEQVFANLSIPGFLLFEEWDVSFPWVRFVASGDLTESNLALLPTGGHVLICIHSDNDHGWDFQASIDGLVVSQYSMTWTEDDLAFDDSKLNLNDLVKALLAEPRVKQRMSLAIPPASTPGSSTRSLQNIFDPPGGLESFLEGDPPTLLADLLGLAPSEEVTFESMLEEYEADPETFQTVYGGAVPVGIS